MSARNLIKIIFNTLLGLVLILIWLHFINLDQMITTIKTINPAVLSLFFLFFILSTLFKSLRLKFLLNKYPFELKELLFLNFISQFLSFSIPIRAGEIAKGVYLSSRMGNGTGPVSRQPHPTSSLSQSFAAGVRWGTPSTATRPAQKVNLLKTLLWVFIDRFLDFWVYIIIVAVLVLMVPNNLPPKGRVLIIALVGAFSLAALMMILANKRSLKASPKAELSGSAYSLAQRLIKICSKLLVVPKLQRVFSATALNIASAFGILDRSFKDILKILILSLLAVGADLMTFLVVYLSFNPQINILKVLLGSGLTVFTFLIPAAPGYVGSVEASNLAIFSGVIGFSANLASSAAVVYHVLLLIALPIFGIFSIYFLKFDLNLVWKRLRKQ